MSLYLGDTPICGGIEGNQLNNPFSLLQYMYSEYELSNASWLLSNGQFNSGATYPAVYNLLLQIYNGTVTKAGVSVKLSTETYADTDFVLNTSDTTFRLPIKVLMAGSKRVAGNGMTLGLTNGTYEKGMVYGYYSSSYYGMVPNGDTLGKSVGTSGNTQTDGLATSWGITTDPTKSGIETSANGLYLYFYVGETIQDANIIAAASVLTDVADLKAHSIVETYRNGTSWYRVYSDGFCIQGGKRKTGVGSYGAVKVNLLKAYKDTNYVVLGNIEWGTNWYTASSNITQEASTDIVGMPASKATDSFYIQQFSPHSWMTIGYIS